MAIAYKVNEPISAAQFIGVLEASGLAERRPVSDPQCIQGMLDHANLTVTAWDGPRLVGVARSVTDFNYCCYLSDLAVAKEHQRSGVGRELIAATQKRLGPRCTLILLSAPAAEGFYPKVGFERHPRAFVIPSTRRLSGSAAMHDQTR